MSDPYPLFSPTNAFSELAKQSCPVRKLTLVIATGDKYLCGGFNNDALKQAESHISEIKTNVSTVSEGLGEKSSNHHDRNWERDRNREEFKISNPSPLPLCFRCPFHSDPSMPTSLPEYYVPLFHAPELPKYEDDRADDQTTWSRPHVAHCSRLQIHQNHPRNESSTRCLVIVGIGTETACKLTLRGVHVILGIRNVSVDNNVKEMILKEIPFAKVDALELDLCSMASVSKIAADFNSLNLPLNILINNTGVGMLSFMLSPDGIENSLLWCNAKGCLESICKVFDELTKNNLFSWNALIGEFSINQPPQMVLKFVDGIKSLLCDSSWGKEFIPMAKYIVICIDGGLQICDNPKKLI
ncbi:Short-chain dehydrogenase TIC 32, chloroplastic [Dendrobium catenatum]|uniref:Short-chain dehydrogenase TIC 32, chloroplastic n=1 Tax=Dendrobium catenatum TaxID=906689 RepID=A0A2I0VTB5_9ASPA|nr:Short-chain dehydrogenase TIC 32, chloroplastic [Dendrobium catenatum]